MHGDPGEESPHGAAVGLQGGRSAPRQGALRGTQRDASGATKKAAALLQKDAHLGESVRTRGPAHDSLPAQLVQGHAKRPDPGCSKLDRASALYRSAATEDLVEGPSGGAALRPRPLHSLIVL